jgi:hypothetical protein
MALANMRAQGVRSLWVVCELCRIPEEKFGMYLGRT